MKLAAIAMLIPILLGWAYVWKEREARAEGGQIASIVLLVSGAAWIAWVTCTLVWVVWTL